MTTSSDVVSTLRDGSELAKRSTGAMLAAEKVAHKDLEAVVALVTAALIDSLSSIDTSDAAGAAIAAHAATRRAHGEIERGTELALVSAIARGRSAAAAHAEAQLAEVNWVLRAYEVPTVPVRTLQVAEGAADRARATSASRAMASRWLLSTTTSIRQWELDGGKASLPQAARSSTSRILSSLGRTAATETAFAYAEEHGRQMNAAAEQAKAAPLARLLYKRWEGALDRKICRVCANHDNEIVPATEPFRGGDVPGQVHPHCRCQAVVALTSTDLNTAHAVTREVAGPGLGRSAMGYKSARGAFDDWDNWTPEMRKAWTKSYQRALVDEDYRARLITPEIRRHLETVKAGVDRHAPVVPRLRKINPMRDGLRTDSRSPRAIHEEYLGRAIGAPAARFQYGELVAAP